MKRDFLTLRDFSSQEINALLQRALRLKAGDDASRCPLLGKSVGLIFEKSSTRTRVSFETGIYQLGGQPIYMSNRDIQLGRGETVADTARTLSRYLNAIVVRTFEHERIEEFASTASVPVINALTDLHHPCQALADLLTVYEAKGSTEGVKLAYIGDGNNVANSLIECAARTGLSVSIASPEGYEPSDAILEPARSESTVSSIEVHTDPVEAVKGAHVVYTDVWVSMGMEDETQDRLKDFKAYQVNESLMKHAAADAIVMHCLPAHRGYEISAEVLDGPQSVVFDQAENRLHAQKALLEFLLS